MTAYAQLANGPLVPDDALRLAWRLEDSGFTFAVKGDRLILRGQGSLTTKDRAALKEWKPSILAIVWYQGPEIVIESAAEKGPEEADWTNPFRADGAAMASSDPVGPKPTSVSHTSPESSVR